MKKDKNSEMKGEERGYNMIADEESYSQMVGMPSLYYQVRDTKAGFKESSGPYYDENMGLPLAFRIIKGIITSAFAIGCACLAYIFFFSIFFGYNSGSVFADICEFIAMRTLPVTFIMTILVYVAQTLIKNFQTRKKVREKYSKDIK